MNTMAPVIDRIRKFCTRFAKDQIGGATVWLLATTINLAVAGIGVDVVKDFRIRAALQSTADIAALAAVVELPDAHRAMTSAALFARKHVAAGERPDVQLGRDNIVFGHWDDQSRVFDSASPQANAVRVTLSFTEDRGETRSFNLLDRLGLWRERFEVVSVATQREWRHGNCGLVGSDSRPVPGDARATVCESPDGQTRRIGGEIMIL